MIIMMMKIKKMLQYVIIFIIQNYKQSGWILDEIKKKKIIQTHDSFDSLFFPPKKDRAKDFFQTADDYKKM